MGKKIAKLLLKIVGGVFVLLVILLLFLRLPIIQTKIAHYTASRLSKQLDTEIRIDKVAMNFVDNATIKGIYIEDQRQDTLLYSKIISIDIAFFKLFRKLIQIDHVKMNTGLINIHQNQDSLFNFQFLIDAFASEDTTTAASEPTFTVDLDQVNISNFSAKADLLIGIHQINFGELLVKILKFDLYQQRYDFSEIILDGFNAQTTLYPIDSNLVSLKDTSTLQRANETSFPLAGIPVELHIDKLRINDAHALIKEEGYAPADTFDSRYLDIKSLQINLDDLLVTSDTLGGEITQFALNLNEQINLQNSKVKIQFGRKNLDLKDIYIETLQSTAAASFSTAFKSFEDLVNLEKTVKLNIDISSIQLAMNNLSYFVPVETLAPFKNEMLRMTAKAEGSLNNVQLDKLNLTVGNTSVQANGNIQNPTNIESLFLKNFKLTGKADYKEYAAFLTSDTLKKQMKEIGDIRMNTQIEGGIKKLTIKNFDINTESLAEAKLSGELTNITNSDNLTYDLVIHHITSGYQDASIFVDSLPEMAAKFDTIRYSGRAKGDLHNARIDGGFITSLGAIDSDISINFNEDYSDASYNGRISFKDFKLGELLENDSLKQISLQAQVNGSGLDSESIKTSLDATIYAVDYNNYQYENIQVDGLVDGKKFSGIAAIDDENIRINFQGAVDMNDSIPLLQFNMEVDTLNLQKLNLADEMLQIKLAIDADMKGINLDEIDGSVVVRDILLSKEAKEWKTDSLVLRAVNNAQRSISLQGDFIDAGIEGNFKMSMLSDVILDFLDQYFPTKAFFGPTVQEDAILSMAQQNMARNDVLDAHLKLFNLSGLAQFFDFPLSRLDTSKMNFTLDLPKNLTNFKLEVPVMVYDGYFIENVTAFADNGGGTMQAGFNVDSVSFSESIHLSGIDLEMLLKDQSAEIWAMVTNQKQQSSLGFTTIIKSQEAQQFSIDIVRDFILNDQEWELNQKSSITVSSDGLIIPEIQINNGKGAFSIAGNSSKIDLSFTDFNLNNIVEIVGVDSLDISGLMNGTLEIGLDDETPISGDLLVNDIRFNQSEIGDLDLNASKEGQDVTARISIVGEEVLLEGDLEYDLSSSYVFGKVLVEKLNLEPFNPFVTSYVEDLSGAMQGYLAIEGELTDPFISGALYFQEVEAFINDLATVYKIKEGKINISDGLIRPTATLEDQAGRLSYLKGDITHNLFSDITFDLAFNANEFLFLNSKKNKREYYYGSFVGQVSASITGTSDLPIISADIKALKGTDFTIQLLSSEAVLTKEDYIVFYDGSVIDSDEAIDSISRKAYTTNSSMELNLTLSTNEDALFHVIVDPVTGDRLDIRGSSNLIVNIPAYGDIKLIGDYIVTEGSYRVSYENTIRRVFGLDAGSKIVFQGAPTNAQLDMRALYSTEVSTTALLERSGNSVAVNGGGAQRAEVSVVLDVKGTLSEPELSFNIIAREGASSPVGNALSNALAQLRQNETQLLEQVGSLILFNSFTGSNSGGNISSMGTSTAVSSVGNLIDGQLNKLAANAKGFEIDFNIDQYRDISNEGNASVTEFGIGLQQKLFNDRLIISAGGNANLQTGQSTSNNFSSFAGDFVIQYLLSRNGKLRVKVFQKSDFNALSNDNIWKTGAGLTYKTKFGQIKPKE